MPSTLVRPSLALCALALVASPSGALRAPAPRVDLTTPVTFTANAAPADRVVAELAKQTGVALVANPQMARDVVLVSVVDTPLQAVLDRLATVTAGKWQPDADGTLRLVPDTAARQTEARAEAQIRVAELREELKKLNQRLAPNQTQPAGSPEEQMEGPAEPAPIMRLIAAQDPNQIARVVDAQRVVFATNPNRMQVPLRGNVQAIVAKIVKQHNAQAESFREAMADATPEQRQQMEMMRQFGGRFGGFAMDPITGAPAKVLLVVSASDPFIGMMFGVYRVQLFLYDAEGKVIGTAEGALGSSGLEAPDAEPPTPTDELPGDTARPAEPDPGDPTKIEYSPAAMAVGRYFTFSEDMLTRPQPAPEVMALIRRPDLHDPLSFTVGESILAVAKARKVNVVACLPDEMQGLLSAFSETPPETIGAAEAGIRANDNLSLTEADGWMTIRPAEPESARLQRQDRAALTALIGAAQAKGIPSLDDMAAYAAKNPPPFQAGVAIPYLATFASSVLSRGFGGMVDWNMLRLWGLLSPDSRAALRRGDEISLGGLSPTAAAHVRTMLFSGQTPLVVRTPETENPPEQLGFMAMMAAMMPASPTDFRNEPTEAMPNGVPTNGTITVRITPAMFAVPVDAEGRDISMLGALDAQELAMLQFFMEDPNMAQVGGSMPRLERFRIGERESLEVHLNVRPDTFGRGSLTDAKMDPAAAPISRDAFSDEFKAQITKALAKFKEEGMPFMGGMGMPGMGRGPRP